MTKKVYHLSSCSTCKRIIKDLNLAATFELQNVKEKPISETELEKLHAFSGSYESLFNRRAVLYRERNLKEQSLTESDYKALILEHYSFLKRPVIFVNKELFVGNSKKVVAAAKAAIHS